MNMQVDFKELKRGIEASPKILKPSYALVDKFESYTDLFK